MAQHKRSAEHQEQQQPECKRRRGGAAVGGRMSDRRLQRMIGKSEFVPITLAVSGARAGDLVRGKPEVSNGDAANVLLRVHSGVIAVPCASLLRLEERLGRDHMVASVANHFGISRATATLRYADLPRHEGQTSVSRALGSSCCHSVAECCNCTPCARFVILSQGVWQGFAEQHGHGEELQAMVSERRVVCWKDVLRLMFTPGQLECKTLILRPSLFEVVAGAVEVAPDDPRLLPGSEGGLLPVDTALPGCGSSATTVYQLGSQLIRLPMAATTAFSLNEAASAVQAALEGLCSVTPQDVERCLRRLQPLRGGGLKSLLQKTIRFHALSVQLDNDGLRVPSALVAATATVLLFCDKGSFPPELQLFTRGCTSAFKRAAVILLEDCWLLHSVEDPCHCVLALTALALACQQMPHFNPPLELITATARLAAKATECGAVVAWRAADELAAPACAAYPVNADGVTALTRAAELLRQVRSFGCDMAMFDRVAELARSRAALPLLHAQHGRCGRPDVMPVEHLVDHHAYRGIAHVLRSPPSHCLNSFASRFSAIFDHCTGFNPRRSALHTFLKQPLIPCIRFAQRCCVRFALRTQRQQLPCAVSGCSSYVHLQLDSGVLAAAVGPIYTKVRAPEDEVVMIKPTRATRDLFGSLTAGERAEAIAFARSRTHSACSPMLAAGSHTAQFVDGQWQLDARDWADVVAEGRRVEFNLVDLPPWACCLERSVLGLLAQMEALDVSLQLLRITRAGKGLSQACKSASGPIRSAALAVQHKWKRQIQREMDGVDAPRLGPGAEENLRCLVAALKAALRGRGLESGQLKHALSDDDAIIEALGIGSTAGGMVAEAEALICALAASVDPAVALRAATLLRQQWSKVAMPTSSLNGGLGADQLAAYENDWQCWRLLVLLSTLAPGALQPMMPPTFRVPSGCLLRCVERWVMQGARASTSAPGLENRWKAHADWSKLRLHIDDQLMEHQKAAIATMHQRDLEADTGHFLVMDTGLGKTVTSLVYALRWLCKHGGTVKRLLWITPAGTTENLLTQLQDVWEVPACLVPRVSRAAKPKRGDSRQLRLLDYHVNVMHADHMRTAIDSGLVMAATRSFVVFDEVDEMYSPTLRTSAARRLALACPKFVAQTATPMRKNESQLRTWLSDTSSFPVDSSNMLVAACGMVSIQLALGIRAIEELVLIPMNDAVRLACYGLLSSRSWLQMAQLVQENTDAAMVECAVRLAKEDRQSHPSGGVLLVSDTVEHAQKLIRLCSREVKTGGFDCLEGHDAHEFAIIVVTKSVSRGYNSAVRLGSMVTQSYAGNGAARHQIRGRLRRIGQQRDEVRFVTVVMENSILHLLHQRHNAVDSMNISLEQLGQKFGLEVLHSLQSGVPP